MIIGYKNENRRLVQHIRTLFDLGLSTGRKTTTNSMKYKKKV